MGVFIFICLIFGWVAIGLSGIANCKEDRINGEMIIFFILVPFIPLFAKVFL